MNSTIDGDGFDGNPFRSGDDFYNSSDPLEQPPPQQQQQQQQFQQSFQQQQPTQQDSFQPQPSPPTMMNASAFPAPSGPMDGMGPAGLMSSQQQQQQQRPPQLPTQQQQPTSWWGSCMMCISLDTYKAYFDIDADDVVNRVRSAFLTFYKPDHFRNNVLGVSKSGDLKGPDLYGPFWVTMTLIFFLGVSAFCCCFPPFFVVAILLLCIYAMT